MRMTNATLTLFENTIIKDCHEEKTTIDLSFTINTLINRLEKKRERRLLNLRITSIRSDKIKRMMRERDRE